MSGEKSVEIVNTRLLRASCERVFDAWTDPATLARWWGPKGFRNEFRKCEPRSGGEWLYSMFAPDGTETLHRGAFVAVERPRRIVIDHIETMHRFLLTTTFAPKDGGTELVLRMDFEIPEEADRVRAFVLEANEQNLDRLEGVLREND